MSQEQAKSKFFESNKIAEIEIRKVAFQNILETINSNRDSISACLETLRGNSKTEDKIKAVNTIVSFFSSDSILFKELCSTVFTTDLRGSTSLTQAWALESSNNISKKEQHNIPLPNHAFAAAADTGDKITDKAVMRDGDGATIQENVALLTLWRLFNENKMLQLYKSYYKNNEAKIRVIGEIPIIKILLAIDNLEDLSAEKLQEAYINQQRNLGNLKQRTGDYINLNNWSEIGTIYNLALIGISDLEIATVVDLTSFIPDDITKVGAFVEAKLNSSIVELAKGVYSLNLIFSHEAEDTPIANLVSEFNTTNTNSDLSLNSGGLDEYIVTEKEPDISHTAVTIYGSQRNLYEFIKFLKTKNIEKIGFNIPSNKVLKVGNQTENTVITNTAHAYKEIVKTEDGEKLFKELLFSLANRVVELNSSQSLDEIISTVLKFLSIPGFTLSSIGYKATDKNDLAKRAVDKIIKDFKLKLGIETVKNNFWKLLIPLVAVAAASFGVQAYKADQALENSGVKAAFLSCANLDFHARKDPEFPYFILIKEKLSQGEVKKVEEKVIDVGTYLTPFVEDRLKDPGAIIEQIKPELVKELVLRNQEILNLNSILLQKLDDSEVVKLYSELDLSKNDEFRLFLRTKYNTTWEELNQEKRILAIKGFLELLRTIFFYEQDHAVPLLVTLKNNDFDPISLLLEAKTPQDIQNLEKKIRVEIEKLVVEVRRTPGHGESNHESSLAATLMRKYLLTLADSSLTVDQANQRAIQNLSKLSLEYLLYYKLKLNLESKPK